MNLKVLAEAGPTIGLGHFTRSLALVQMVSGIVSSIFYGLDISLVKQALDAHKIRFQKLNSVADFINHVSKNDIVLMDGYGYDSDFQKAVKEKCYKLLFIDDKHDKTYYADFIINPAPGSNEQAYKVDGQCEFLLGPDYALLRPSFLHSYRSEKPTKPTNAVVCFGGADPDNLSHTVVKHLLSFKEITEVHLIIGPAYSFYNSLEILLNDNRLKVSRALDEHEMAETLAAADFAIVPSSGILYECLGVGTPAISGYYIDNQLYTYQGWLSRGAIIGVEKFDDNLIKQKVAEVINGEIDLKAFSENSPVDGKSPDRFVKVFTKIVGDYEI